MKYISIYFLLVFCPIHSQEGIEASFVRKSEFNAGVVVGVDNFENVYFINNNVFYKKNVAKTISYTNLQLGNIKASNVFNPLKINLFYSDFNTAVILDNKLTEIFRIDFNTIQPYKDVSHVSNGFDSSLWLFNQNTRQLELYDYQLNVTRAHTISIQNEILDLKSNYNRCWLLTKDSLYVYDYFCNLLREIKNDGYTSLIENKRGVFLKKENDLYHLGSNSKTASLIVLPNLLINRFFVTNETLYIYGNRMLQIFQLKIN